MLDGDTLLLEYALGEERSYLWAVSKDGLSSHELPPRAEIEGASQRAYDRLPGLSAAVVHHQEVIWSGGVGVNDLATNTPATDQTIYSICSISKLFTSVAVMQQRDAGKLRLDDPLTKHLPWATIRPTAPEFGPPTVEGMPSGARCPQRQGRAERLIEQEWRS